MSFRKSIVYKTRTGSPSTNSSRPRPLDASLGGSSRADFSLPSMMAPPPAHSSQKDLAASSPKRKSLPALGGRSSGDGGSHLPGLRRKGGLTPEPQKQQEGHPPARTRRAQTSLGGAKVSSPTSPTNHEQLPPALKQTSQNTNNNSSKGPWRSPSSISEGDDSDATGGRGERRPAKGFSFFQKSVNRHDEGITNTHRAGRTRELKFLSSEVVSDHQPINKLQKKKRGGSTSSGGLYYSSEDEDVISNNARSSSSAANYPLEYSSRRSLGSVSGKTLDEILAPQKVLSDEFEAQIQKNLGNLRKRNSTYYKESVLEKHRKSQIEEYEHVLAKGDKGDARRDRADNFREKVKADRKYQEKIAVAAERYQLWCQALNTTLFAVKTHQLLQQRLALRQLKKWLPPIVARLLAVRRRKRLASAFTESRLDQNPRPTPTFLREQIKKSGDFFQEWQTEDSSALCDKLVPRSFRQGEYIMYAGDFDRVMYILTSGSVDILIPKKQSDSKKRVPTNSLAVITVQAPAYFGEFAILCKEPRSASIRCKETCDAWAVSCDDFNTIYEHLSGDIRKKLDNTTDLRRKKNLKQYFPMRMEAIKRHAFFEHWRQEELQQLIAVAEPSVLRAGTTLYNEGELQPIMYFLADGRVRLSTQKAVGHKRRKRSLTQEMKSFNQGGHHKTFANPNFPLSPTFSGSREEFAASKRFSASRLRKPNGFSSLSGSPTSPNGGGGDIADYTGLPNNVIIEPGETFGEFEGFFNYQPRRQTATTESSCDIWSLRYQDIIDIGMNNAAALIESRKLIQQMRASRLIRPLSVPEFISHDPSLRYCVPPGLQALMWASAEPRVFCSGEYIVKEGDDANEIFAVFGGLVSFRFSSAEWSLHSDCIEVDQQAGQIRTRRGAETSHKIEGPEGQTYDHNFQLCWPHVAHHYQSSVSQDYSLAGLGGDGGGASEGQKDTSGNETSNNETTKGNELPTLASTTRAALSSDGAGTTLPASGRPPPLEPLDQTTVGTLAKSVGGAGPPADTTNQQQQQPVVGFLLGSHEFATRKNRHTCTVRALSTVEVWVMNRSVVEAKMNQKLVDALDDSHSIAWVTQCIQHKKLLSIYTAGVQAHEQQQQHGGGHFHQQQQQQQSHRKSSAAMHGGLGEDSNGGGSLLRSGGGGGIAPSSSTSSSNQTVIKPVYPPACRFPHSYVGASHDYEKEIQMERSGVGSSIFTSTTNSQQKGGSTSNSTANRGKSPQTHRTGRSQSPKRPSRFGVGVATSPPQL